MSWGGWGKCPKFGFRFANVHHPFASFRQRFLVAKSFQQRERTKEKDLLVSQPLKKKGFTFYVRRKTFLYFLYFLYLFEGSKTQGFCNGFDKCQP